MSIKRREAHFVCFCGRSMDIELKDEEVLAGQQLFVKCKCGLNINIRVQLHARAIDHWPGEVPAVKRRKDHPTQEVRHEEP